MNNLKIKDLKEHLNEEIEIQGFIDNIRNLQYVQFIILRDGTGKIQITIEKSEESNKELVEIVDNLTLESTVKIKGKLLDSPKVKLNGIEIIPTNIEVTSKSEQVLPIDIKKKDNTLRETRLDWRFLDLRREDNKLLFECQTYIEHLMREYWLKNDYMEIHTPKISASSAESGAEMFKLDYFGQKACLSQSPQFYKQMAMSAGFNKVFEIGPVFRAENSHTSYHATEIEMVIELCPGLVIGVTGSEGKTTTTTLIYEILKEDGYNCFLGGNIGIPLFTKISERFIGSYSLKIIS